MKTFYRKYLAVILSITAAIMISGCGESDMESIVPGSGVDSPSGEPVAFSIVLADNPAYNTPGGETRSAHHNKPLISEWVKVNSLDATRPVTRSGDPPDEEPEKYSIALMELYEDSVSGITSPKTRSIMPNDFYFRVIAFRKVGGNYVFQSAADYTSGGGGAPVLRQGNMILPIRQTYKFVAYSFNNGNWMGAIPGNYQWRSTVIPIPDMWNDFLTYESGDILAADVNLSLPVSFRHMLCEMNVQILGASFRNCQGVYIRQGGNASQWTVGLPEVARNYADSYSFNIGDNFQGQNWRLVPSTEARQMQVHINSVTFEDIQVNNIDVTASQSIPLQAGMHYTMKLQFKLPGINVSNNDINLTANGCTQGDKDGLSRLKWADGNLKSTSYGSIKDYVWTTPTDYGYYYTWMSTYTGTGSKEHNGIDPCSRLNPGIYGTDWRTPNQSELIMLSHCTDKQLVDNNGVMGMWFMNSTIGLFLPAAAYRHNNAGCGMKPSYDPGSYAYYWSSTANEVAYGSFCLNFKNASAVVVPSNPSNGYSVRCVKGAPQ